MSGENKIITVSIVDDHPAFRDAVRLVLASEPDIEVVAELGSGHGVMEMLSDRKPDVLLLDLVMPGVDGMTALKQIQESEHTVKTIILTESEDANIQVLAVRRGACGFVVKTKDTSFLVEGIRKVHEGEIWLDNDTLGTVVSKMLTPEPAGQLALSKRQMEVVNLVCQGLANGEIARCLGVSESTVKRHLNQVFKDLGVSNRIELVWHAVHRQKPMAGPAQ
jgi:DNA-binding NarL/FixJ family response regulator